MIYLPGILTAYAILVVGTLSPGPSVMMLFGIATSEGRARALVATLGIALGSMTINILTLAGMTVILAEAAWAMTALRWLGAAFLLYLAWGAFRRAKTLPPVAARSVTARSWSGHLVRGYLLQVVNPKAVAFWLAIAAIGAVENAPLSVIGWFVLGAFLISFVFHAAWAVALSTNPVRVTYRRLQRWIETTMGCLMSLFAGRLATSGN